MIGELTTHTPKERDMTTTTYTLPDGTTMHYRDGELHDPAPGTPAMRGADGTTMHYRAGKLQDPAPGVPAVRYADGKYEHYRVGDRVDPSDVILYEDWERGYCLRIDTAGHIRAGCRRFATLADALTHWEGEQPDYVRALRSYVDTLTVGDA